MPIPTETRQGLKSVYVARTVETTQKKFDQFLKQFAQRLGGLAAIKNIASTHLTFLESRGVKDKFYDYGYSPAEVKAFKYGLERHLMKGGHQRQPLRVEPEPAEPLRWMTRGKAGKLAVAIAASDELLDVRGRTEEFLVNQLGVLPEINDFNPHITIGKVNPVLLTREVIDDPCQLLPSGLLVPGKITLNGLEVFLGQIHPGQYVSTVTPAAAQITEQLADIDNFDH